MSTPKDNPVQSRFWDQFNTEDLYTADGFKARFGPTKGGGSNTWPNRRVKASAQIADKQGKSSIHDIGVFYISRVKTALNSDTADLELHALTKPLQKVNAEKVKNGTQWWENVPLSFLISRLLETVYKEEGGQLSEKMSVSRQDLADAINLEDHQLWNLGVPPNWDGQSFQPSPNANPVTAMVDIPGSDDIVVGLGGYDGYKAELWRYNGTEDLWTKIASNEEFDGPIQSLVYNTEDDLVYGICWKDLTQDQRTAQISGHKWLAPDAKLFWKGPSDTGGYLDDSNNSIEVEDFFPGLWDVREMFPLEYGKGDLPQNSDSPGELSFIKDGFKASVGNYEAIEQISSPLPGGDNMDRRFFPLIDEQDYRYDDDPLGRDRFSFTQKGETDWTSIEVDQTLEDTNDGDLRFAGGQLSGFDNQGDKVSFTISNTHFEALIKNVKPDYNYRVRLDADLSSDQAGIPARVSIIAQYFNASFTTLEDAHFLVRDEPWENGFKELYIACPFDVVKRDRMRLVIRVYNENHSSGGNLTVEFNTLSVVPCLNWSLKEPVAYQAGENIPVTQFSKVVAGIYNERPTNNGLEGPGYDLYNGLGEDFEPIAGDLQALAFVPGEPDIAFATDAKGSIYRTGDQGLTWRRAGSLAQLRSINDIYMHNPNEGWLVGDNGIVANTENASSTTEQGPVWLGVETEMGRNIRILDFYNSDVGWFSGNSSDIYLTTDGGVNWQAIDKGTSSNFSDFEIINENTLIACRSRQSSASMKVHKTTNQGADWSTYDIDHEMIQEPYTISHNARIAFLDSSIGFIVARVNLISASTVNNFQIFRTMDGGETWTTEGFPFNPGLHIPHNITDLILDGNRLVFTTSAGIIYSYNHSTEQGEILYQREDNKAINAIENPITDLYLAVGDDGVILRSEDRGSNWSSSLAIWKAEEVTLDFNLIAQNRKRLAQGEFDAFNPLFGPSDQESGISVDNSLRQLIANRFGELPTNDLVIEDMAPAFDYVTQRSNPWVGLSSYNANPEDFKTGEAGVGYLSVVARTIGNKGGRWRNNTDLPLHGIVRYTNGQQGLFDLAQGANQGKGMIVFAQRITDNDPGIVNDQFKWGPGDSNHRFKTKLVAFNCDTKQLVELMDLETQDSPNPGTLYNEQTQFPYPIAGASHGSKVFISLVTNPVYTNRYLGDNQDEVASLNRIHEIDLQEGSFNVNNVSDEIIYDSRADQSVYNVIEGEDSLSIPGNVTDEYAEITEGPAGPINRTRKITHLHYSSRFDKLFGSGFRKDSLLSHVDDGELTPPCHEVFYLNRDNFNELVIVDHDTQEGVFIDAIKFTGFAEDDDRIWYYRLSSPTINPHTYQRLDKSVKLSYIREGDQAIEGGHHWDGNNRERTKPLREARRFISHDASATSIASMDDPELERFSLFSGFDHYFRREYLTEQTLNDILGRPHVFFKVDSYGLDKRIELADFNGLKVWDAIKNLANANNMVFGFNGDRFFMTPRSRVLKTHTLETSQGQIKDIEKDISDDIRNLVSVTAYSPQQDDGEWEVTHVSRDSQNRPNDIEDERLFDGELDISVTSPEQGSVLMICTRRGRLLVKGFEEDAQEIRDAKDHIWDRNPVLFKWLTHSPSMTVTLMQEMGADDRELLVSTLYQGSDNPIRPGDIVVFTDQEEMEPVGKVIEKVDPSINLITLEESPGFAVEKFLNLTIIRSHLGTDVNDNSNSTVRRWGDKFSDEGIAVVKDVYRGAISSAPSNRVIQARTLQLATFSQIGFMEFTFESPHQMARGNTFSIIKTGDPDFRFSGEFTVNSFTEKTVRVTYQPGGLFSSSITPFFNQNKTQDVFLSNDHFEAPLNGTILKVNSLNAFRGVRVRPYAADYRHFNFLVTTFSSNSIQRIDLPNLSNIQAETQVNTPMGYVHAIDFNSLEISLGPGDYTNAFAKGDVLNAHYLMAPPADKEGDLPYQGLSQHIPGGFGSWRWTAEPQADLFNIGDVVRVKFGGLKLEQDGASTYTLVDSSSINKWGENEYTHPDNRFIQHKEALSIAREIIKGFSEPGLLLSILAPYNPDIGFMTKSNQDLQLIEVIDPSMFPSFPGYKVSGTIRQQEVDLGRKTLQLEITTRQKY